ncbi:hypothetical protein [Endozoicomonas numazuensis]|uniref:Uncharacterized protein n=1 Tax=Endozoicomonas numazuensis TaxID=1137799 RepID=A0A081NCI6_9GAMM|nr:hypothetical protein [Endozoicomonas numazuensis]KEQ16159.1 hypothetical protein GZ78_23190 [Endozoicomonas numazuensis]
MAPSGLYLSEPADIDPDQRIRFESGDLVYGFCIVEDPEIKSVMAGFIAENSKQCIVSGVAYDRYKEFQLVRTGLIRNLLATMNLSTNLLVTMIVCTVIFYVGVVLMGPGLDD